MKYCSVLVYIHQLFMMICEMNSSKLEKSTGIHKHNKLDASDGEWPHLLRRVIFT
jgi:hypothetical protein